MELMNPSDYEVLRFIFTQLCVKHLIIVGALVLIVVAISAVCVSCLLKKER